MSTKFALRVLLSAGIFLGLARGVFAVDLPNCADGQTLIFNEGELMCGPACPAYAFTVYGFRGTTAFNIPAGDIGDVHPPADNIGLPSGDARNGLACTFHLQCSSTGWIAYTTAADNCHTAIQDVP